MSINNNTTTPIKNTRNPRNNSIFIIHPNKLSWKQESFDDEITADNEKHDQYKKTTSCSGNFQNYLYYSTLHGLRYVGESTISIFERSFFFISFLLVLSLSIYFISHIYEKWVSTPVIITLNAYATSVTEIPFPAVTICDMNQARQSVVHQYSQASRYSYENIQLQSLCDRDMNENGTVAVVQKYTNTNWTRFREFLVKVSTPCKDVLIFCKFAAFERPCMKYFQTVLTDEGLCCIFNRVHPQYLLHKYDGRDDFDVAETVADDDGWVKPFDWTLEEGYGNSSRQRIYPRPGSGSGSHIGLTLVLNTNLKEYHCSTTNCAGFKILLHSPIETPKISDYGFSISAGFESRVIITPRVAVASPLIRKIPVKQRQCFFNSEGNLTYFRSYTRKNCEMECESRFIIQACGCVLYYMPKVDINTNICSRNDAQCYEEIKLVIERGANDTYQCNCLPGCFEINYSYDVSYAQLGLDGFAIRQDIISSVEPEFAMKNYATMHIYYEDSLFRSMSKEEFIGFTDFLSNTGGLLGLFMGFSVVSIIEILYFLTIRPYCTSKRNKQIEQKKKQFVDNNKFFNHHNYGKVAMMKKYNLNQLRTTTMINHHSNIKSIGTKYPSFDYLN